MKNQLIMKNICPVCHIHQTINLGEHIRREHGEGEFRQVVLRAKESGMSDSNIGEIFGITFRQLEKIITEEYGINISVLKKTEKGDTLETKIFQGRNNNCLELQTKRKLGYS